MKILLAEKDKSLREILNMLLASFKYEVVACDGARETLAAVKSENPDLILIDRDLSESDGLAISKMIKEDFLTAYIPIIVLFDRKQLRRDLLTIEQGIDDYIIKPADPIDLQIRIELAVRRATHQFFANALTKLPGNRTIQAKIEKTIESGKHFTFGYVDIDHFKYFNDRYGYIKGNQVIIQTSQIISRSVKLLGNTSDFVGHVGGDDFVFLTTPDKEIPISEYIIKEFDRLIPLHYSKEDRVRGGMQAQDRQGTIRTVPLMSISIALVDNVHAAIATPIELSRIAFEIKHHLKRAPGSKFLKNRRVRDGGLHLRPKSAMNAKRHIEARAPAEIKKPIGQLLLEARLINEEILDEALARHWDTGQRLGATLIGMGVVDEGRVAAMLKLQEAA